jgi:hypothetical protein
MAYPLQFWLVLEAGLPSMLVAPIGGVGLGLARAIAGLIAAKSIRAPTKNTDSLVDVCIKIHAFFV